MYTLKVYMFNLSVRYMLIREAMFIEVKWNMITFVTLSENSKLSSRSSSQAF